MKRINRIIALAACLIASATAAAQSGLKYEEKNATVVSPEAHVATIPVVADVSIIGDRVTEKVVLNEFRVRYRNIAYIDQLKTIALAKISEKYDADLIIATNVSVSTENKRFVFTITGYPARYTNFRNASKDDMTIIMRAAHSGEEETEGEIVSKPRIIRTR